MSDNNRWDSVLKQVAESGVFAGPQAVLERVLYDKGIVTPQEMYAAWQKLEAELLKLRRND